MNRLIPNFRARSGHLNGGPAVDKHHQSAQTLPPKLPAQAAVRLAVSFADEELSLPGEPLPIVPPQPKAHRRLHDRILIADDDATVRGSIAGVLQSEGFEVEEAGNGIQAVTRAIEWQPDLVLLDLNMPHWDGWTAFSQLDRVTPFIPAIVITARPNEYEKAVTMGVDAFMEKPLNFPTLVQGIRTLIKEHQTRSLRRGARNTFVTEFLK